MIVKRLREKRNWSQEQLATLSGLSTRTIQRIESGNKASIESLKALASVFEIDISKLQEEIIVIDKTSKEWNKEPLWVRFSFWGVKARKQIIMLEMITVLLGLLTWLIKPDVFATPAFFLLAYIFSNMKHYIDTKKYW
ncbi:MULTISPECIES: helix-turn-helix domain-containing protein [Alteromonas]|uniref:DNA-binding protein n=1 Tax=Alteromonas stellipolaris TaxID=233316 RepID=A0ABN4LR55_9ALTE|nr:MULTISPECIES: helix-turn-helix transcriptional regulator [Alteromonas]ALM90515.1 helix-turn-helix domain protein [Alteromonas stellipolaris LMG 21856]AMJ74497.1 DNA-binding protein [Alteromonas stellipolaris]AMJ86932.1 DNA-binding protein [Alteromonas sp. Mac1]AMJ90790.1 DNA-binding protein [Alteromonas sp. Mac2]